MPEETHDIQLRSESVQEILSNPPSWLIRWGITVIFVCLLAILAVSWFVKYPDFISAPATITSANPPEKIEARINGKIDLLLVENHTRVYQDQILAVLQSSAESEDILLLKSIMDTLKPNYQNFNFPFHLTRGLSLGDLESAYLQLEKAQIDLSLQKELQPFSPEVLASQQSLNEIALRIKSLQQQKKLEKSKLQLKKMDLNRNKRLYEDGVIPLREYEAARLDYLQAEQSYQSMDISISQLKENQANVRKALASTSIGKSQAETEQLSTVLQSFEQLKKSLREWEQQYLFKASIAGKVSFQSNLSENQFVKTGQVVFTILPDKAKNLVANLTVPAANSGKIEEGQRVILKLDNYPYQQYGAVEGRVKSIALSPDSKGNYFVEVILLNRLRTTHNHTLSFDQELSGTSEIVTEDLRLIERLFYQFRSLVCKK